jgi:transposase-like protein
MDKGDAGWWFGIGFTAIVCLSWLMWPLASWCARLGAYDRSRLLKAAWVPMFFFVIGNAIMFTAQHRTETVSGKTVAIDGYEAAKVDKARMVAELDTLKTNSRWAASQGCTNATAQKSKDFCDGVKALQGRIQAAQAKIETGRPGSADAGAETLAWVLQGDAKKIGLAWPVYIAIMLELAATLALKFALSPWTPKGAQAPVSNDTQDTVVQEAAQATPDALAQVKALVLASPNRELTATIRWLARALNAPRSTVHDWLKTWHASGQLAVESKGKQTVVRLADQRAA